MVRNKRIYLASIIITTLVFLSGIGIGIQLNREKTNILENRMKELENEERNVELQWMMLSILEKGEACELMYHQFLNLMTNVGELEDKLITLEKTGKIMNPEYVELKKDYSAFQIKYWLFAESIRKSCPINNKTITTILFFYSKDCQPCESQGFVLSYLKGKKPGVMVYSFDTGLDYDLIDNLEIAFNVTETPSLVINSEERLVGLTNFEELSKHVS